MSSPADRFVLHGGAVLAEKAAASCAVASAQGRVFLAWTGSDMRINTMWSSDGYQFGGKQTYPHRTYASRSTSSVGSNSSSTTWVPLAPAITAGAGGVHLAWTDRIGRPQILRLGGPDPVLVRERTEVAPALGTFGELVVLAWTGRDRRVNLAYGRAGAFGDAVQLRATTSLGPAVCSWGSDLAVAWTGSDRRLNVLASSGGRFGSSPLILDETSYGAPAICVLDDRLVLAWTGSDRRLNLLSVDRRSGASGPPSTLDAKSSQAPAVCPHLGGLLLAWIGTDHRVNVARVLRTR